VIKREIPWAPGYLVAQNGQVFHGKEPVSPEIRNSKYSKHLVVWINDNCQLVESLIRQIWFGDCPVFTRNGDPLAFQKGELIVVEQRLPYHLSHLSGDLISFIWELYRKQQLPCSQIRATGGLQDEVTESNVQEIVSMILNASIRL
jgi:hypothetical protein